MANKVLLGNVKGDTGATGAVGATGANGANGLTPYVQNGTWWLGTTDTGVTAQGNQWFVGSEAPTTQGNEGDLYLNSANGNVYKKINSIWTLQCNIKGAKGDTGAKGDKGDTALTVTIGTTTTGEPDSNAEVVNAGTNTDLVLNFTIPKGEKGANGVNGQDGINGLTPYIGTNGYWYIGKENTGVKAEGKDGTIININGSAVDSVSFDSDPQAQIDDINSRLDETGTEPFVFNLYSDFVSWLNGSYVRTDNRTTNDLEIGSDIYLKEEGYPDYWCSSLAQPFSTANFTAYESKTTVDTEMSDTSENAVENKVIKNYVDTLFNSIINGNEVKY